MPRVGDIAKFRDYYDSNDALIPVPAILFNQFIHFSSNVVAIIVGYDSIHDVYTILTSQGMLKVGSRVFK